MYIRINISCQEIWMAHITMMPRSRWFDHRKIRGIVVIYLWAVHIKIIERRLQTYAYLFGSVCILNKNLEGCAFFAILRVDFSS